METEEPLHSRRRNWKNNRQNVPVTVGEFVFKTDFKRILLNSVIVTARVNYDVQVSPVNNQGAVINHFTLLCHFEESFHIQMKNVLLKFWPGPTRQAKQSRPVGTYIHLQCLTANKQSTTPKPAMGNDEVKIPRLTLLPRQIRAAMV